MRVAVVGGGEVGVRGVEVMEGICPRGRISKRGGGGGGWWGGG